MYFIIFLQLNFLLVESVENEHSTFCSTSLADNLSTWRKFIAIFAIVGDYRPPKSWLTTEHLRFHLEHLTSFRGQTGTLASM